MGGCALAPILIKWAHHDAAAVRIAEAEGFPGHAGAVQASLDHIAPTHTR